MGGGFGFYYLCGGPILALCLAFLAMITLYVVVEGLRRFSVKYDEHMTECCLCSFFKNDP